MSREGVCGGCHRKAWLDRCRGCANWFCDLCFTGKSSKHAKLLPEDTAKMDVIANPYQFQYWVFE